MIRWITEFLGTGPFLEVRATEGAEILDVRDLADQSGNDEQAVREKIQQGAGIIRSGRTLVVACDYGISRSNSVAAGILAVVNDIGFRDALNMVVSQTGEKNIKLGVLKIVERAVDEIRPDWKKEEGGAGKLLLTGGTGYLGSGLLPALAERFDIIAPARGEIDLLKDTVALDSLIKSEGAGGILHLADPRIINVNPSFGESLVILKNILDVCVNNKIKLYYPSTCAVYAGGIDETVRPAEGAELFPVGSYAELKYLGEQLISCVCKQNGLDFAILRLGVIYGGSAAKPKFLSYFFEKALRSEDIYTHVFANGNPCVDLLHMDDLASALIRIIEKGVSGAMNVGGGACMPTKAIAQNIVELTGSGSVIKERRMLSVCRNIQMDTERMRNATGWVPEISLGEGLEKQRGYYDI